MPFVGRTAELGILAAELERAGAGEPRVVMIEGDAGVGKSTLLARFSAGIDRRRLLRAGGDDAEMLLSYGVLEQLMGPADGRGQRSDLAAGAELLAAFGRAQGQVGDPLVVIVDDLHWADLTSATALLFAIRRLRVDHVLVLLSSRPGALARLGDGWARFVAGDERVVRLALPPFGTAEISALGHAMGLGDIPPRAVAGLLEHTGGNALYCRALLEELTPEQLFRSTEGGFPAPRALAGVIVSRLSGLSASARELVLAASVLGRRSRLRVASGIAGIEQPAVALAEAEAAGLVTERRTPAGPELEFAHPLVHRAIYDDLSAARRRELHARAAELVDPADALDHRVAAADGVDEGLAAELEAGARRAISDGRLFPASGRLAQAAALSVTAGDRERRLLDALEQLLVVGHVAGAALLEADVRGLHLGARASGLLGHLAVLRDDGCEAERLLLAAWEMHDPDVEPDVGAAAALHLAQYYTVAARAQDALMWAQRGVDAVPAQSPLASEAAVVAAGTLGFVGRAADGLALLDFLPEDPARVPRDAADVLAFRGIGRLWTGQPREALGDLKVAAARVREGVPMRFATHCLSLLGDTCFRLGAWDDAVLHTGLAVSLARDADRLWHEPFVHGYAAIVPACRGEWEIAAEHVRLATAAAARSVAGLPLAISQTAAAFLAAARGDHTGVITAATAVRAFGDLEAVGHPGIYGWRALEVDALVASGRLDEAAGAVAELDAATPRQPSGSPAPAAALALARLRGTLASARGDHAGAASAFASAWQASTRVEQPFELALLALADGRRLRRAGQRAAAIGRLRQARSGFGALRARPYAEACERELERCGAPTTRQRRMPGNGLTPAELAVARLVAGGATNRQAAEQLFVTVKTIEFHLRGVFAKLRISSRAQIARALDPGVED